MCFSYEVMEVSGYVKRVSDMLETFEQVSSGTYVKDISESNKKELEEIRSQGNDSNICYSEHKL